MRNVPFTRPTLVAAVEMIGAQGHNGLNRAALRLGLEREVPADPSLGVAKKFDLLGRVALPRAHDIVDTIGGTMTLGEALVREAVEHLHAGSSDATQRSFERGLARDGYVVEFEDHAPPRLRSALPDEIRLPESDDEVHQLLKHFGFGTPLGHFDQAIDAHTRGDWAACNAQLRTFLESLFDAIAMNLRPQEAAALATSENRRVLLCEIGFLAADRKEWSSDAKNYIGGLFKMLHTEGSHPGLSDEDHSTFRLHVVIVTARTFLRRLYFQR